MASYPSDIPISEKSETKVYLKNNEITIFLFPSATRFITSS